MTVFKKYYNFSLSQGVAYPSVFFASLCLFACDPLNPTQLQNPLSGGEASVALTNADAFSQHSANLTDIDRILTFNLGNDFFENPWVTGSASTSLRDGLGGLFNNNACQDCHVRDGRGNAPHADATGVSTHFSSTLLKATRTHISDEDLRHIRQSRQANVPDPAFGGQLQHRSVVGVAQEVALSVRYTPESVTLGDGETVPLRRPLWHIDNQQSVPVANDTVFSIRVSPGMSGLGLLALIPEQDILANEDPADQDQNGISGKANWVWSLEQQAVTLGRFGWRAGQPSIIEQTAGAFVNDMGLTSRLHLHGNCQPHQKACLSAPNGNGHSNQAYDYEVSDRVLDAIAFYASHLAVPKRRSPTHSTVQTGQQLFLEAGCADCHTPTYVTESHPDFPELSHQTIYPYTDLLLHDMGVDLADIDINNQPSVSTTPVEYLATAQEWRTPPLWGIGLAKTVNPKVTFLHDGRAQTLLEAILWHGGEAEAAREAVKTMSRQERDALLAFLNDL